MRVLVTGASGVLGSAIYDAFKDVHDVKGLAYSKPKGDLVKLDLLDAQATESLIADFKPEWVIHCAAERRPDVAARDPEAAERLNAAVPATLASLSAKYDFVLFYISTDYVFDGTTPPYEVNATTNPVNFYGKTKLAGEHAVQAIPKNEKGQRVILRVPVLYGPAPNNSDTAINVLLDVVSDQSGKVYKMDHYATRYPTNTIDIASFLVRLSLLPSTTSFSTPDPSAPFPPLPPILHYSASEPFTKYEICLLFATILGVPHAHIQPDAEEPKPGEAVSRPRDCQLSTRVIEDNLGMDVGAGGFEEWWRGYVKLEKAPHVEEM